MYPLILATLLAIGQLGPAVHESEIYRRGDLVQETGGIRSTADDLLAQALAPPADDSDKWFIAIICDDGCPPCERLKRDLKGEELRHWYQDSDGTKAWAHLTIWHATESRLAATRSKTMWRFEKLKITQYPTIVIQPPKNGTWGPNSNVAAMIVGYDGDPERLSQVIRTELRKYVAKMLDKQKQGAGAGAGAVQAEQKVTFPPEPESPKPNSPAAATLDELLQALPAAPNEFLDRMIEKKVSLKTAKALWARELKLSAPKVDPQPDPPSPTPSKSILPSLLALLTGGGSSAVLIVVLIHLGLRIWDMYRQTRKANGQTLVLTDEQYARLRGLIDGLATSKPNTQSAAG